MFQENLKSARTAQGLSQEELAARLHVVRQTISKWEHGLSVPDAHLLLQLSEVLEVPVHDLLGDKVEFGRESQDDAIARWLEQLNRLLAEKQARNRRTGKIIGCVLLGILALCLLLALAGMAAFHSF